MKSSLEKGLKIVFETNRYPALLRKGGLNQMESRWDSSMLIEINMAFDNAGKKKGDLPLSPFKVTENGLHDFRGFQLAVPLVRLNIKNSDFSWTTCRFGGSLNNCIFEDSIFRFSNFDGYFFVKQFQRCDLAGISIKNGSLSDSIFIECDFSEAKLTSAMARGAKFIRCNFEKTNFSKGGFDFCLFEDCVFKGAKFKNTTMIGNTYIGERPEFKPSENVMLTSRTEEMTLQEAERLFFSMLKDDDD